MLPTQFTNGTQLFSTKSRHFRFRINHFSHAQHVVRPFQRALRAQALLCAQLARLALFRFSLRQGVMLASTTFVGSAAKESTIIW